MAQVSGEISSENQVSEVIENLFQAFAENSASVTEYFTDKCRIRTGKKTFELNGENALAAKISEIREPLGGNYEIKTEFIHYQPDVAFARSYLTGENGRRTSLFTSLNRKKDGSWKIDEMTKAILVD